MRAGCDAALLDLHGAMVIEDCDDAEGEIVRRLRAIAPRLPIAVTLDYHTNLSAELVANATVITGYKTYPHVDMYEVGKLAGEILLRALGGEIEPVMAWGWLPLLASIMRHAPEDGPSGDILRYAREMEAKRQRCSRRRCCRRFRTPTRRTPACRRSSSATPSAAAPPRRARSATACWRSPGSGAPNTRSPRRRSPNRSRAARKLGEAEPGRPVLLIDHCDNCGSGGAQDVMAVVAEILRQRLDDVAIAPIRDPAAVAQMIAAGSGQSGHARARRQDRHAGDRPQGRAARGVGQGRRDHRRRVHDHRADVHRHPHFPRPHRGARHRQRRREGRDRRHRARARADGRRRVHPLRHRPAPQALHHAQVAHPLPRRLQADRRAHRRMRGRRASPMRTCRCIATGSSRGRSFRSTRSDRRPRPCRDEPRPHARLRPAGRHRQHLPQMGTCSARAARAKRARTGSSPATCCSRKSRGWRRSSRSSARRRKSSFPMSPARACARP